MKHDPHALPPPLSAGRRDVNRTFERLQETPERRGASVAQDRPLPTREHSSHESPVFAEGTVTDRVDTLMHPMQSPDPNPVMYRVLIESESSQLPHRRHPVLAGGEPREAGVVDGTRVAH